MNSSSNLLKAVCRSENGDITAIHFFLTVSDLPHRYGALETNKSVENC